MNLAKWDVYLGGRKVYGFVLLEHALLYVMNTYVASKLDNFIEDDALIMRGWVQIDQYNLMSLIIQEHKL